MEGESSLSDKFTSLSVNYKVGCYLLSHTLLSIMFFLLFHFTFCFIIAVASTTSCSEDEEEEGEVMSQSTFINL